MRAKKIFSNAEWIIACRVIRALMQLAVGMLSARYLGPSGYGLISYAASVVAFFIPLMQLGLDATLVQEYVDRPDREGEILGTGLVMNLSSAVACVAGVTAFAFLANPGQRGTVLVCVLYGAGLIFQSMEMLRYWFQAKLLSKYSAVAALLAYLTVSAYKIWLLVSGRSVYWFALSHAVEYGVAALLLFAAYRRKGTQKIRFSFAMSKEMLKKSSHYIWAMLLVVVFNSTANILLKHMAGEAESGFYAAAATCVGATGFVFGAIIDTARPVILEKHRKDHAAFRKNLSRLYGITTYLSLVQSVAFTALAGPVIRILYGPAYEAAVPVLQILMWNTAFSYMGYVRNIWLLGEGKHRVLFVINLSGAAVSLAANACLIPLWGACGAAAASVITQVFTNFIMGYILTPVRENNRLLKAGLDPRLLADTVRAFLAAHRA